MIITLILTLILLILILFLCARVRITVNTNRGLYKADYGRGINIRLVKRKQRIFLRIQLFFIRFNMAPWNKNKQDKPETEKARPKKQRKSPSLKKIMRWGRALYSSVSIKRLNADIDTGDFPLNAQLIPLTALINGNNRELNINFEDRNQLDMIIQTRPIKILWNYSIQLIKN